MKVYIEIEELKRKADAMMEIASELNENMTRIENLVLNLGTQWQGRAELEFTAKLLFVKKQFDILNCFFIDYSQVIHSVVAEFEAVEEELLSKMEV